MLSHAYFPPSLSCLPYTSAMKTPANTLLSKMAGHKPQILLQDTDTVLGVTSTRLWKLTPSKCLGRYLVHFIQESTSPQRAEATYFLHFSLFWLFRAASVACSDTHSSAQCGPRAASPPHTASKSFFSRTCSSSPNKMAQSPLVLWVCSVLAKEICLAKYREWRHWMARLLSHLLRTVSKPSKATKPSGYSKYLFLSIYVGFNLTAVKIIITMEN